MSSLEGVPVKMPRGVLQEAKEGAGLVTALEIRVPDYLAMLRDTEYEFSLENWVLTGLQGGYPCQPRAFTPRSPSEVLPSCPPYWLMFSSPQQSRLASRHSSDFWEPNPRQRSRSLNPAVLRAAAKFTVSDSEDEPEVVCAAEADASSPARLSVHSPLQRKVPIAFTPNLLNPPACLSGPQDDCSRGPRAPTSFTHRPLNARANTVDRVSDVNIQHCKPTNQAPGPFCHSLGIPPVASQPLGSCGLAPDSSVELLSALSPEERELLGAITEQGYPLRTAFIALQKTGQQTPDLILSYLVACRNLCERGYDEDQVEEALEMFQNCETKAEEFLHLLGQFNEMGFQQSAIKEVLLVHENHRERALEELMMRMT